MIFFQRILFASLFSFATLSSAWAKVEAVIGPVPLSKNNNVAMALPTTANSEILISRDQYLISYNKNRRAPNWVAWKVEANQLGTVGRSNKFQQDTDLETYLTQAGGGSHAVLPTDFQGSCFDRGHQIPSADRTDTAADNIPTFDMSNMIPQTPYLNRVIWEQFEAYTRTLVLQQGKKVFIFAGPVYDIDFGAIGPAHDIQVPSKDFKIVFILDANQTAANIDANTPYVAVVMPNTLKNGQVPVPGTASCAGTVEIAPSADTWEQYKTTLADVEQKSGLTFTGL